MSGLFNMIFALPSCAWQGVDETVVEKIAGEHGRQAAATFINGDLLLFAFVVAGLIAGFAAGYWYRMLFCQKNEKSEKKKDGRENSR